MLKAIVSWALNMRLLVVAIAAALLVIGINATRHAPLDVFPEFAPPLVEVQTYQMPALGLDAYKFIDGNLQGNALTKLLPGVTEEGGKTKV